MGHSVSPLVTHKKVVDAGIRRHDETGMVKAPVAQIRKSFLVLFFKKELLSSICFIPK
jgi:hypothetical protein